LASNNMSKGLQALAQKTKLYKWQSKSSVW
jgi:hypothetical protein